MSISDPIADAITVIRNANRARKPSVDVKASKLIEATLSLFKKEGFIANFKPMDYKNQGLFRVYLKYGKDRTPAISDIRRISKPGIRKYVTKGHIPTVFGGLGIAVISTSKGIMTNVQAKEAAVGGEILLYVW